MIEIICILLHMLIVFSKTLERISVLNGDANLPRFSRNACWSFAFLSSAV